ncbi:MAG: nucleoside triphosphate pyrophosphohydrolase [Chthonomonas sp.]|nr:nucleoside triphosphate pyrophosphohydrolase [Chthonomonas sp.]
MNSEFGDRQGWELLVYVVDRLLGPGGCPWDQEQTHESLKKYLLEESYELMDAIDSGDNAKLKEELGDVLLQPIMHAQMQKRDGGWDIEDVAQGIADKLIHRHPHVFGDASAADSAEVLRNWDRIKQAEKGAPESILDGIPRAMPALARAMTMSKRAARAGFEWTDVDGVWAKLDEELAEFRAATTAEEQADEMGDVLFTMVNIARWHKLDAEASLARMLDRFAARFKAMEAASDRPLADLDPEAWEELWQRAKEQAHT